jgi:mannose-6-phosphate isomerase-like protein (cupin superfamily)
MTRGPVIPRRGREPFTTKDGATVTELVHPSFAGNAAQSVAEAIVEAGRATTMHLHRRSEEIYLFTSGTGRMTLADEEFAVAAGDAVPIPPGTPHKLTNGGDEPLVLLCVCAPAYSNEDTELLE